MYPASRPESGIAQAVARALEGGLQLAAQATELLVRQLPGVRPILHTRLFHPDNGLFRSRHRHAGHPRHCIHEIICQLRSCLHCAALCRIDIKGKLEIRCLEQIPPTNCDVGSPKVDVRQIGAGFTSLTFSLKPFEAANSLTTLKKASRDDGGTVTRRP
ncbi:MAG: hypothetical protein WDN31_12520 [Hyphomicrobium sp.]